MSPTDTRKLNRSGSKRLKPVEIAVKFRLKARHSAVVVYSRIRRR